MPAEIHLPAIMLAALVSTASPGPATLAIASTAMTRGRRPALALASGITCGSLCWSIAAALGLSALMLANARAFEALRILGAAYFAYLALKSARAALRSESLASAAPATVTVGGAFRRGLALHLTNPKAIFFFGALYSVGVPGDVSIAGLAMLIALIGAQSFLVFHGYALLFSRPSILARYRRARRGFEAVFALAFGAAAWKIFSAKLA